MATLKCLACGHDNNVGDEACTSCSSSLNLKLCSACEAINANSAERCHSCNAEFGIRLEAMSVELDPVMSAAPPAEKALPAAWVIAAERAKGRSSKLTAALWLMPLMGVGLAYYVYSAFYGVQQPELAPKPEVAQTVQPPQTKTAPAPVAAPAPVVKTTTRPVEPKRAAVAVTHTQPGAVAVPLKTTTVAASALLPAVSTSAPAAAERRHVPVTHTRAAVERAAEGAAVPAAAALGPSAQEERIEEPAGCAPGVAALGLCKTK